MMVPESFRSDNVYAGIPYRVLQDASIEALMPNGHVVSFSTVEQFVASAQLKKYEQKHDELQPASTGQTAQNLPVSAQPIDYYNLLLDTITETQNNSAQLRQLVYERMRFNFKRDLLFGHSNLAITEVVRHVNDFEIAVKRIEAKAGNEPPQLNQPNGEPASAPLTSSVAIYSPPLPTPPIYTSPVPAPPIYTGPDTIEDSYVLRPPRKTRIYRLIGFSVLGIVVVAAVITIATPLSRKPVTQSDVANETEKISAVIKQEIAAQQKDKEKELPYPIPTSYGIYALSNNQLTPLETLPISVPDPRVMLSAEITKPSNVTINDNKPSFILFRRDLLNNAPQTLFVRVVAQVRRETKIAGGKSIVTPIENAWRIRNIVHELKVSPVPGQAEMIIAQTETPLAAGRYALVLNRTGYEFTVAGKEEAPEFCLEGFESTTGNIFTECKNP